MLRNILIGVLSAAALSTTAVAQDKYGSAAEARAMLERAVVALKANEPQAIGSFNTADGGFRDRDLYPFCFIMNDGKVVAHVSPDQLGLDVRTIKDAAGKTFGLDLFNAAKQDQIAEVGYMWPRPGSKAPEQKVSYVTRIGDVGCGVGYYK
jgi:hypothetical protein